MAFNDIEKKRIENEVSAFVEKRRPAPHIRPQIDIGFRVKGQSIEIFEIRPDRQQPELINEVEVAKATYVKTQKVWKLYWMRADLKWHTYPPLPTATTVARFLEEVNDDPHACFWG